jgi:hypothetical protein
LCDAPDARGANWGEDGVFRHPTSLVGLNPTQRVLYP